MRPPGYLLLFAALLWAQDQPGVFRATTQLVIETVTVTDSSGKPISGLTSKDFAITENGVQQEIKFFEEQKLDGATTPIPQSGPEHIHVYDKLTPTQITPESPGQNQYTGRRLLAMYFDMTAMAPAD